MEFFWKKQIWRLFCHHIRLKNNFIHDCPGTAIDVNSADYLIFVFSTIQANGNLSSNNNWYQGCSFVCLWIEARDHIQIMYNSISDHRQGPLATHQQHLWRKSWRWLVSLCITTGLTSYQGQPPCISAWHSDFPTIITSATADGHRYLETNNLSPLIQPAPPPRITRTMNLGVAKRDWSKQKCPRLQ